MKAFVRAIDAMLRRARGVYEFSDDPSCVLRIQRGVVPHELDFDHAMVPAGVPALALHLWNERVPRIPSEGADLGWATALGRSFRHSLHLVGDELLQEPALQDIKAVGAFSTGVFGPVGVSGARVFERLGFKVMPYHSPLGRFGSFWENLYSLWLMWAFNSASLHSRRLMSMERSEMWMTAEGFVARYGTGDRSS
jgi:hypothetical protein